jgi:serine/threonine-protein kinase RsbW
VKPADDPTFLKLRIDSDPAKVAEVRRAVEEYCRQIGMEDKVCCNMGLCVNEALANVICHAYHGQTGRPIEVMVQVRDDRLEMAIRDWGSGENPASQLRHEHDPLVPGGLGMVCLRQLMDDVVFTPQPDGMLLTMTCRCQHNKPFRKP